MFENILKICVVEKRPKDTLEKIDGEYAGYRQGKGRVLT